MWILCLICDASFVGETEESQVRGIVEASRLLVDKSVYAAMRRYGAWEWAVGRLHGSAELPLHDVPHFQVRS